MKQKMITVGYSRIPKEVEYRVKMTVDVVNREGEETWEDAIRRWTAGAVKMEEIIEELHHTLKVHPDAKVTMIQEPTGPLQHSRKPQGFELDEKMRDLIRDDLEEAKKMFAPIDRTVRVRPAVPRINVQEG
jgi:hypothetical protein